MVLTFSEDILKIFGDASSASGPSALNSLEHSEFAKILETSPFQVREGYEKIPDLKVAYRFGEKFPEEIEENWREVCTGRGGEGRR
jgi:hypothetical protein